MIPDAEKVVSRYLREHTAIIALQARVVGKTPKDTVLPWVRVTELDAPQDSDSQADHLVGFYLQLDCYAGADRDAGGERATSGQPEAKLLARTVRAALQDITAAAHADCVITGVHVNGASRIPDPDLEPARERVILTTTIHAHTA